MKKIIISVFIASVLLGCMREVPQVQTITTEQDLILTATHGDPETRTMRDSNGAVLWSPGDEISLFYGSGSNGGSRFKSQNTEPAKVVNFTGKIGVITGGNDVALEDTFFWAVYPYNNSNSCDGSSITTVLPAEQKAKEDTFDDNLFPSIGRSRGLVMGFYNICGGLKFTVSEEGITSVTLKGNNNEIIVGTLTVSLNSDGLPVVTSIAEGSDSITLSAPDGESFEVGKSYYIIIVPTVFENGFTLTFHKPNANAVYNRTKKTTIRRSAFGSLSAPDAGLEWNTLEPIPTLSEITTIPQSYEGGLGALYYHYIIGNYLTVTGTATGTDFEDQGQYAIRAKNRFEELHSNQQPVPYSLGAEEIAEYYINPPNYKFETEVSQWGFNCLDRDGDETHAALWSAEFKDITRKDTNVGAVTYKINNAEMLNTSTANDNIVSVLSFYGIDAGDDNKIVSSDLAAVVTVRQELNHFAFIEDYQATECSGTPVINTPENRMLFDTAAEAAENPASISVPYNNGALALDFIGVHIKGADQITTIAQLQTKYPDINIKYELIDYTLGSNMTVESAYGIIEGKTFYPAFAATTGYGGFQITKINNANYNEGISSVGRRPIVLVTLVDNYGQILLAGYFKIVIVNSVPYEHTVSNTKSIIINNFGEIGYACEVLANETRWCDMSYQILESTLNMSYSEFRKCYSWEEDVTYEKTSNGSFVATSQYGNIDYIKDNAAAVNEINSGLNDIFRISVSKTQADAVGVGLQKTLYAHFTSAYGDVFFGVSFKIGEPPSVSLIKKNPAYWFNDLSFMYTQDARTNLGIATIRSCVRTPMVWLKYGGTYNSVPVTMFNMDLDDNWYDNRVKIVLQGRTYEISGATYYYRFSFDNMNVSVNGKKWTRVNDGELDWNGVPAITLTSDGVLSFACNSSTKQLINWGSNPQDKANNPSLTENYLYCNVDIVAQIAGSNPGEVCDLLVEQVHVRFLRPVSLITNLGDRHLVDGIPSGSYMPFGAMFGAEDWSGRSIFSYDSSTLCHKKSYYPEGTSELDCDVDWFDYYGISQLIVDMDNIETDITGTYQPLKTVNPSAILGLIDPSDPTNPIISGKKSIYLSDLYNLGGWQLWYANNMGYANDFNLRVNVSLSYAWGQVSTSIVIPVYGTMHSE